MGTPLGCGDWGRFIGTRSMIRRASRVRTTSDFLLFLSRLSLFMVPEIGCDELEDTCHGSWDHAHFEGTSVFASLDLGRENIDTNDGFTEYPHNALLMQHKTYFLTHSWRRREPTLDSSPPIRDGVYQNLYQLFPTGFCASSCAAACDASCCCLCFSPSSFFCSAWALVYTSTTLFILCFSTLR